jgi:hypothetical protein
VVSEREGYPANAGYVNEFIRTLEELKITRGMEAGPSFAPRFGMDENASSAEHRGLTAVFSDAAGKELAKVSLGKNIESGGDGGPMGGGGTVGRYIRNHADESGFYAINELFPSINDEPARWLADGFFSPEKIKTISLTAKNSDQIAWKVTRDTEEAEFKLDGATGSEVLDTAAATPLKSLLSFARFDDVVPAADVAGRADAEGKRTAVIETFEGFVYTLQITPTKAAAPAPAAEGEATPAPASDEVLLTVSVVAELPKERKKEEGEKEEDAKTKDAAFTERLKTLTEKLQKEKAFEGRTFLLSKSTLEALLKERADIITKAQPPANTNTGTVQELPGGIVASPPPPRTATTPPIEAVTQPVEAVTQPIEAVTPPIAIPPLEEKAEKSEATEKKEE